MRTNSVIVKYGKKTVLNNLSLEIGKTEIVGIVGKNGAGKTTLIKLLSGLIFPKCGTVENNENVSALIEQPGFFLDMTGKDNVEFFINRKLIENEISCAPFEINQYLNLPVKSYSMGMKQKLGIWITLLKNADYLLLDEPTNSLDITGINELNELLLKEKQTKGIVVVSHNNQELQKICDKIVVLDRGNISKEFLKNKVCREKYIIKVIEELDDEIKMDLCRNGINAYNTVVEVTGDKFFAGKIVKQLAESGHTVYEVKQQLNNSENDNCNAFMGNNND